MRRGEDGPASNGAPTATSKDGGGESGIEGREAPSKRENMGGARTFDAVGNGKGGGGSSPSGSPPSGRSGRQFRHRRDTPSQRFTRRMLAPRARPSARPSSTVETVSDLRRRIDSWTTRRRRRRGWGVARPSPPESALGEGARGSDSWLALPCEPSRVFRPLGGRPTGTICWTSGSDGRPPGIMLGGERRLAAYPRELRDGPGDGDAIGRDAAGMMDGGERKLAA